MGTGRSATALPGSVGWGFSTGYTRDPATGRLTTATKSAAQFTAGYNALGQRVTKTSTGTSAAGTRLYARDETGRPLGVYVVDSSASNGYRVEEEYVHLDGWRPVAVVRPDPATGMVNPKVFPILTDHLGTPRKVLDGDTGQTRWAWDAKQPFGHELPNETPTAGLPAFKRACSTTASGITTRGWGATSRAIHWDLLPDGTPTVMQDRAL